METHDIYQLQQERSRRGCLWMLIVLVAAGVAVGAFYTWRWWSDRAEGIERAEPLELPGGAVEEELPPAEVPAVAEAGDEGSAGEVSTGGETAGAATEGTAGTSESSGTPETAGTTEANGVGGAEAGTAGQTAEKPAAGESAPAAPTVEAPRPTGDAGALYAEAEVLRAGGDLAGARAKALEALEAAPGDARVEGFLGAVDMELMTTLAPMPEKVEHVVSGGDYLGKLAAKYNTPVGAIRMMNGLRGDNLRIGQRLTLLDGQNHVFAVRVSKSRNDLLLTLDGRFFKRYRVSTGAGGRTPAGSFKIVDKIEHPTWYRSGGAPVPYGDPENLLGTHWLALDVQGYGIHGTWEPETLGRQSSAGCIRLLNEEVEELYNLLPKGTAVTVED